MAVGDPVIDSGAVDAVLFDMDGVLTDTAATHMTAWTRLFDEELPAVSGRDQEPFTPEDYRRLVDGRARIDGVVAVLADRGIDLPLGSIDDPPGTGTAWALANRKNQYFHEAIEAGGVDNFPSSIALLDAVRARRVATAVVTASRNRAEILESAGLADRFDATVDGTDIEDLGLPGKPDPATFLEAARRLGTDPGRAVVIEDAVSGVAAGRAGGFGLVIGVARHDDPEALRDAGADAVVADLAEVKVR